MKKPGEYRYGSTLLHVKGVSLTLGGNEILRDINVEVKDIIATGATRGQVIGFLGPSGIGKTQFLQVITGLRKPTSGEVLIGPDAIPVHAGAVGKVPQNYLLFDWRTVLDNLLIAGGTAGLAPGSSREKAKMFLDKFGLWDKRDLYPQQLSGGQRQRISIAQQMMCSDHYLTMDEPFSGLDLVTKDDVAATIADLASADELNTIIIVTHDVTAAVKSADHVWLMGRDHDASGNSIPGARIVEQFDLIERDLCWHPDIATLPGFTETVQEIEARFRSLA